MSEVANLIGLGLNAVGTVATLSGSIINATGRHKSAYICWNVSNLMLFPLFLGVAMGWFEFDGGAWIQVCLYIVYMCTNSYGLWKHWNENT